MNLPKSLKVGGHQYTVVFPYVFTERSDTTGQCDHNMKLIRVASEVGNEPRNQSAIMVTFIHEVLHAVDDTLGQSMFHGTEGESCVEALSEGIYQVLVDNGYLGDYYGKKKTS